MRHFLDIGLMRPDNLRALLDEAHRRKTARAGLRRGAVDADAPLAGAALAMIFQKASTRTRVSFEIAIRQLGGSALVMSTGDMQLGRGETIADTAMVLSRMVDAVMIRANRHQDVLDFAAAASVPVINGLTDRSHPCQILADLMTIEERLGPIAGKTVAWVGDGNNVCASFLHAAPLLGFQMRVATPDGFRPRSEDQMAADPNLSLCTTAEEAVTGADVVVTDTWVSMGDQDHEARMAAFPPFAVDDALLALAAPHAVFLHCLPAHRGEEVTDSVMDGPQSAVWDEAENRIHAQKAVLLWCLAAGALA